MSDATPLRIIDYGPYTQSNQAPGDPAGTTPPPLSQMEAQVDFIATNNVANTLRIYTLDDQQSSLIDYAISDGLNVIPSVILPNPNASSSDKTPATWSAIMADPAVMSELNSLISTLESLPASYLSKIPFVDVGNEEISQVGGWSDTDIEDAIEYVKQNLPASLASQLQFTTAETYEAQYINLQNGNGGVDFSYNPSDAQYYTATNLGNNPNVNVIFVNIHPYWDGISVSNAASYVAQVYQTLEGLYPDKEIVISETGWPSSGPSQFSGVFTNPQQSSVPSLANEQTFWEDFLPIANEQNISFGAFEAYDEPNKGTAAEDSWGLIETNSGPTYTTSTFKTAVTSLMPLNASPPAGTTAVMITTQASTGNYEIYDIGNNAVLAAYPLTQAGSPWQTVYVGGFKDSETSDLLLRNSTTGDFELFDVSGNNAGGQIPLGGVGLEWQVLGFGDFSGNPGETDMLMRNSNTSALEVYDISNNQVTTAAAMGGVGPEWQLLGIGDFSSNPNESGMLLRDVNNGALEVYNIGDNTVLGATGMGGIGLEWSFVGVGDFSSNPGETDMLMRDVNNGALEVYNIRDDQVVSAAAMGGVGLEWSPVGIGDFSGNPGETDMLMRDTSNGAFEIYDIRNDSVVSASSMGGAGTDWQGVGIAPYQSAGTAMVGSGNAMLGSATGDLQTTLDPPQDSASATSLPGLTSPADQPIAGQFGGAGGQTPPQAQSFTSFEGQALSAAPASEVAASMWTGSTVAPTLAGSLFNHA